MILTLLGDIHLQKLCRNGKKNLVTKQRFLIGYDAFDALRKQKSIPSFMTGQCMENEGGEVFYSRKRKSLGKRKSTTEMRPAW